MSDLRRGPSLTDRFKDTLKFFGSGDERLSAQYYRLKESPGPLGPWGVCFEVPLSIANLVYDWVEENPAMAYHWLHDCPCDNIGVWYKGADDQLKLAFNLKTAVEAEVCNELGLVYELTSTSRYKAPVTLSDRYLLPVEKKIHLDPDDRCILRGAQSWRFDIPRVGELGVNPERPAWCWFRSRVEEAILLSHTVHAYAEFEDYKWRPDNYQRFPPLVSSTKLVGPPRQFGPAGYQGQTLTLHTAGSYEGEEPVEHARLCNEWAEFIFRFEDEGTFKIKDKPRFLPLTHMVATMVLDHRFTDSVAFGLFATFPSCVVKLTVNPMEQSHSLRECQAGKNLPMIEKQTPDGRLKNEPKFRKRTLQGLNGATVVFLACVVVHNPTACAKLLSLPCTGAKILHDLKKNNLWDYFTPETHLTEWSARILDIFWEGDTRTCMRTWARNYSQMVAAYVGRDTGALFRWNAKVWAHPETNEPFPTAEVLQDALTHGSRILSTNSAEGLEYLQSLAFASACTFGAVVQFADEQIQKRERRTQNIQSLSAVAIEWGANLLRFVATAGLHNLQVDLTATKEFFDNWLDDRKDAYVGRMKEGLLDVAGQLQMLVEAAFAHAGKWNGSELERKRCTAVAQSFQTCFNKNLLLCLKKADYTDFQIQVEAFDSNRGLLDLMQSDSPCRDWLEPLLALIHKTVFVDKSAPMRRPTDPAQLWRGGQSQVTYHLPSLDDPSALANFFMQALGISD